MIDATARDLFNKFALNGKEFTNYQDVHNAILAAAVLNKNFSNEIKGRLFETFVHAMLVTDPLLNIKHAYKPGKGDLTAEPRLKAFKQLKISDRDNGIDLVMIDGNGRVLAVQDKFKANSDARVTYGDLATFYSQSQLADVQVIATSGSYIDEDDKDPLSDIKTRIKYKFEDLHSLSPERIKDIVDYINTDTFTKKKRRKPKPHQEVAYDKLREGFDQNDRIQYISACGTGKTFVSAHLTDEMLDSGGEVVVFVPSLNLMKQTIESWSDDFADRENYTFQAICSDESVTGNVAPGSREDNAEISVEDLKCVTTTNVDEIQKFLKRKLRKDELKVTFCTYQSSPVLSEAMKGSAASFDLGILDEAHRTAVMGQADAVSESGFTYPLHDARIPITQRLSMTATPRVRKDKTRDDEEDSYAYSMDNEDTYGPVAHEYKFSDAVKEKVIVPFKIVISAVMEDDIKEFEKASVKIGNSRLERDTAIAALALKKAIEDTGAKNVVTYQSRTRDAEHLSNVLKDIMPSNWNTDFVKGTMSSRERSRKVSILGKKDPAIITNAKVMTEGVDVPVLDMVAFVSNMDSGTDIVQITGRVMRKAEGKEHGYVVLPVVVDRKPGQSIEQAAAEANFPMIYKVINALTSEDEDLMAVINEVRAARGSGDPVRQKAASEALRQRISFSFSGSKEASDYLVTSEAISRVIETKIVDRLTSSFYEKVEEFRRYLDENDGVYPSAKNKEVVFADGTSMGNWVSKVRSRRDSLSQEHIDLLDSIGFYWRDDQLSFSSKVEEFKQYLEENDGVYPSANNKDAVFSDKMSMGGWVNKVRSRRDSLSQEHIDLLDSIGFKWDDQLSFSSKVEEFKRYLDENDGVYPAQSNKDAVFSDKASMGNWVRSVRRRRDKLSHEDIDLLNSIGFKWEADKLSFSSKVEEFKQYLDENDGSYPTKSNKYAVFSDKVSMANWVSKVRSNRHNLPPEHVNLLNSIGFKWEADKLSFSAKVEEFKQHLDQNDGVYPSQCNKDAVFSDGKPMGRWVGYVRKNRDTLSHEDIDLLNSIGFKWEVGKLSFSSKVEEFKQYLDDNNGVYPSRNDKDAVFSDNTPMGIWVSYVRSRKGKLPQEHFDLLNFIDFKWSYQDAKKVQQPDPNDDDNEDYNPGLSMSM